MSAQRIRLADHLDAINDRYGEYVLHPASIMGMEHEIIKRMPFHATRDTLSETYSEPGEGSMVGRRPAGQ
jgi:hypothetical protein